MTDKTTRLGRLTLPIERGIDAEVRALVERLGADAVRNSDGTELPLPRFTARTFPLAATKSGQTKVKANAFINICLRMPILRRKVALCAST